MRTLLAIVFTVFLVCVTGCGNYVLKSEVEKDYISRAEVEADYVPKAALVKALEEGFGTASTGGTTKALTVKHTCRYFYAPNIYVDVCLYGCPPPPYWQDRGVPCPQ